MKTYLQACSVPVTQIGQTELPRLIMGIHPTDGYGYISAERDQALAEEWRQAEEEVWPEYSETVEEKE